MSEKVDFLPWTEKYRPKRLSDIVGQSKAIEVITKWIADVRAGKKVKPLLLHGPPGTGKTSTAYAIARELDMDVLEINASDLRNRERLSRLLESLGAASLLSGKPRLLLFDEIDALPGEARTIASIVKEVLKKSPVPIILTANDPYEQGMAEFRGLATMVRFNRLRWQSIYRILRKIASEEGLKIPDEVLRSIARNSKGDLRAAINDFEGLARGSIELVSQLGKLFGSRDVERNIFELMRAVFLGKACRATSWLAMNVDVDPDMLIRWIEENVPAVYKNPKTLALAYEHLSRADLFLGRIIKTQNWKLLSYATELTTMGVCSAKIVTGEQTGYAKLGFPAWVKQAYTTAAARRAVREIARRLAAHYHVSSKVVIREILPVIKVSIGDKPALLSRFASMHGIDPESLHTALEFIKHEDLRRTSRELGG